MSGLTLIRGGRVIDPASKLDKVCDILIENDVIRAVGEHVASLVTSGDCLVIDAKDRLVVPGFVDLHVHFREPGTKGETIASGVSSAVAGGFTTVCVMPNTTPAIDNGERVAWQHEEAARHGKARVKVVGAITAERAGKRPSDILSLSRAGAVAISDDGSGVQDAGVMRDAMIRAAELGLPVSDHAEDACIAGAGVMNAGYNSRRYGVQGKPPVAEEAMIARDIEIARATDCHLHVAHLSTARGVELVRRAKNDGVKITAEVTPHHLDLTERNLIRRERLYDIEAGNMLEESVSASDLNPNMKMNPPLRTTTDQAALIEGLRDGTIDAIATDHAPHPASEKAKGIVAAPNGVVGLETAFSVAYSALALGHGHKEAALSLMRLIGLLTSGPARIFGLDAGTLRPGSRADLAIIDMREMWRPSETGFRSQSQNSPWFNELLSGRVMATFVGGEIVHSAEPSRR